MKKLCIVAILILLVVSVVAPVGAFAASDTSVGKYVPSHKQYTLTTIVDQDNQPMGVKFSGWYFGLKETQIAVVANVYSSPEIPIDFFVGDENLSGSQLQIRTRIIEIAEQINLLVRTVDECANTQYDGSDGLPISDVYRYNSASFGDTLQISKETFEMLSIAREMYTDTNGAFNPAVYRLVDLWGFSTRLYCYGKFGLPYDRVPTDGSYPLPDQKYIDAFSQEDFVDFSDASVTLYTEVTAEQTTYYVTKNVRPVTVVGDDCEYQQWLDLGGIAKGYVVDEIKSLLAEEGFARYYVDAGSSSSSFGQSSSGGNATLYLADAFDPTSAIFPIALLGFDVSPCSVSTSGQYIRKYTTNGVEYSHIIDGSTGAPAQTGVKAVMVVVPQSQGDWAGKSDCLTTALTVMGRDKIVEFINGYLKEKDITVVVLYETLDGNKQILTNVDKDQLTFQGENFSEYGWGLKKVAIETDSGETAYEFAYDANAVVESSNNNKIWIIVLSSLAGLCLVALVTYYFVRGKRNALAKVQSARKDKAFKPADIGVYLAVVLVIVVLFAVFFGNNTNAQSITTIEVLDMETGEQLFVYSVTRVQYQTNTANSGGWQIDVERQSDGLIVTLNKVSDGETLSNVLKITTVGTVKVKMTEANCSYHKDCVTDFNAITKGGGAIVCSPHRIKIVTE